ncbi:hypothetical protein ACFFWC_10390 [Plantactinospora siamensis]|uniref:DUF4878 domain-containing protein n=1 Tax=Plantactinospora siamensis TaxID=555372 RepID=A0ABV6NV06_9ACTN
MPGPPPGQGATPPFAAPPTEGRTTRLWLGLGAGALAAVLCCGGGGAALVGLVVSGTQALNEQARVVVSDYLQAVRDKEFDKAYGLLCEADQQRESPGEFSQRLAMEPDIASYQVGKASNPPQVVVPVTVTYATGDQRSERVELAQDSDTGRFEVCGIG